MSTFVEWSERELSGSPTGMGYHTLGNGNRFVKLRF